jgi:hypothetical protein
MALGHLRLAGYALAGFLLLAALGWVGHLVEAHKTDQARLALGAEQLAGARAANQATLAAFDRFKEETARAQAALAEDSTRVESRAAATASLHREIANVATRPGPAPSVGPYTATALRRLRDLRATTGDHASASREGADPGAAARLPARP